MRTGAVFSDCRTWRYALWREWDEIASQLVVIGLNPSTADEMQDDPTIRRCIGFAKREGLGKLVMLNLFAFRATQPRDMFAAIDPIGPQTDTVLRAYATDPRTAVVVAAWGGNGTPERVAEVASIFSRLECFGRNKDGSPKHPLYLKGDTPIVPFRGGVLTPTGRVDAEGLRAGGAVPRQPAQEPAPEVPLAEFHARREAER